jgi:hypothetical protein
MVASKSWLQKVGSVQEVAAMASWKQTAGALFMPVAKTARTPRLMSKSVSGTIKA